MCPRVISLAQEANPMNTSNDLPRFLQYKAKGIFLSELSYRPVNPRFPYPYPVLHVSQSCDERY
jgi:hypothetical protein